MELNTIKGTLLAAAAISVVAWTSAGTNNDDLAKLVSQPVGKIEMKTLEGTTLSNKDFKGKVVLIDFWATWCGPCVMASPVMQKLHTEFKDKGLLVIGANTFEEDGTGKLAREYKKEHKYTYAVTYNNDKLAEKWGIQGIPTFVIVGVDGKVAKTFVGFDESLEKEMRTTIQKLLPKK